MSLVNFPDLNVNSQVKIVSCTDQAVDTPDVVMSIGDSKFTKKGHCVM